MAGTPTHGSFSGRTNETLPWFTSKFGWNYGNKFNVMPYLHSKTLVLGHFQAHHLILQEKLSGHFRELASLCKYLLEVTQT